jgi:uncharacterized protein (DUF934 family)
MALIDVWGAPLPDAVSDGVIIMTLEDLCAAHDAGTVPQKPAAVRLAPGVSADTVAPHLASLSVICIEFPKFRDGRGFTLARDLRQQYCFAGDLRAIGHLIPDQLAALRSCGFSTVLTSDEHPPEQWVRRAEGESPPPTQFLHRLMTRSIR